MRGTDTKQSSMLCLVSPESRVPESHPLRAIKKLADEALARLSPVFDAMYSSEGRPSIPPERLLKSMLLMALYTVRSERLFCEQLDYNLLFRWFLDMDMVEDSFVATVFTKNRDRLIAHDVAHEFLLAVVAKARAAKLMSNDHFTVDGTLIESWASLKSFKKKGDDDTTPPEDPGNPTVDFHGEKRSNATHESETDPDAKLARKGKGKEAKLSYSAHALMENRNGLVIDLQMDVADGYAERRNALEMIDENLPGDRRITLGGDKGYDTRDFVADCRARNVTPHVAQNITKHRGSMIDARTTGRPGYAVSQRIRKRVEEIFGWMKTTAGFRKTRYIGLGANQIAAYMIAAAFNLLRIARLTEAT
ncbi:MAG TPA: IS5 family transposase [Thermoanaerobaculia bacterium]|jgi:transposase|nr:IS5 family transposase [Thermoanaerobaculia bacterium]